MVLGEWCRRIAYLLNRRRLESELRQEMEAHREMMGDPVRFGNTLRLREEARDVWGWKWLDDAWLDLRYSARTLRRSPAFAVTACLILSLGIGLNLTFFQMLNVTVLQPLAVRDPQTLVRFWRMSKNLTSSGVPYPATQFYRFNNSVLSAVLTQTRSDVAWGNNAADRLAASFVSANWFSELGYGAALGRVFSEEIDEKPDASPVLVVSHEFWQLRLGADPSIVGKTVRINDRPAVVIGVASAGFPGLRLENTQIWMPIHQIDYFNLGSNFKSAWSSNNTDMYGRLRRGISPQAAKDGMRAAIRELARQRPEEFDKDEWLEPRLGSVRFEPPQDRQAIRLVSLLAGGLALLVLVIACSNLGNLVLSRAVGRVRELSLRTALGASRWRVMRRLITESLLLAGLSSMAGLALSYWAAKLIARLIALPPYLDFTPDWRTMLAAISAGLAAIAVVGLLPAWKITRGDLTLAMKDGGQQTSAGLGRTRLRQVLLASQVAGSCLLLVVTGLMGRGLQRLVTVNPGFDFANVAVLDASLPHYGIKGEAARSYWLDVKQAVASHPQTESVALASHAPLSSSVSQRLYPDAPGLNVTVLSVEPEFFGLMRIPLLFGRVLEPSDDPRATIVISKRLAMATYGKANVVGRGFPKSKPERTIVGVAGDAALITQGAGEYAAYAERGIAEQYLPLNPEEFEILLLIARARKSPEVLLGPMREAARASHERILANSWLMKTEFENKIRPQRLAGTIAGLTSLLALTLACLGVFGTVSYGASLRTKEIAIRMALGARRKSIVRMLLRQLSWSAGLGMALGLTGGVLTARAFESVGVGFSIRSTDGFAYTAALLVFVTTAGLAALLPALRALRADLLQALRCE